jgi:hypothetical protein
MQLRPASILSDADSLVESKGYQDMLRNQVLEVITREEGALMSLVHWASYSLEIATSPKTAKPTTNNTPTTPQPPVANNGGRS